MTAAIKPDDDQLFLDAELQDELDDTLPDVGDRPELPWEPSEEDEARVDRYLRGMRHYGNEVAANDRMVQNGIDIINAKAAAEIKRLEAWREQQNKQAQGALNYMRYQLQAFSEAVGRTTRKSPFGSLKWKKGSTKTVVADPAAFCAQHAGTDMVRVKPAPDPEPDLPAIARHIKANGGEIPEGADRVTGESTFVIDVPPPGA